MRRVGRWLGLALFISLIGSAAVTFAHTIGVDPGPYQGFWSAGGHSGSGPATIELPSGRSFVRVGAPGGFYINIRDDGTVIVENGVSAIGGIRTLTFNIAPIMIDPSDYPGSWYIEHVFASKGQQTVSLVKAFSTCCTSPPYPQPVMYSSQLPGPGPLRVRRLSQSNHWGARCAS
jgi:hypothetical protein